MAKQRQKGFGSTSAIRKAIRDTSSALMRSPIQVLNIDHCHLTSVMRLVVNLLHHYAWKSEGQKKKTARAHT